VKLESIFFGEIKIVGLLNTCCGQLSQAGNQTIDEGSLIQIQ
jgi:hypothetical protein